MFKEELKNAKTVIWNGPLGLFEFDQFAIGTNSIAKVLSEIDATTIIGGGDSAAAVEKSQNEAAASIAMTYNNEPEHSLPKFHLHSQILFLLILSEENSAIH